MVIDITVQIQTYGCTDVCTHFFTLTSQVHKSEHSHTNVNVKGIDFKVAVNRNI